MTKNSGNHVYEMWIEIRMSVKIFSHSCRDSRTLLDRPSSNRLLFIYQQPINASDTKETMTYCLGNRSLVRASKGVSTVNQSAPANWMSSLTNGTSTNRVVLFCPRFSYRWSCFLGQHLCYSLKNLVRFM